MLEEDGIDEGDTERDLAVLPVKLPAPPTNELFRISEGKTRGGGKEGAGVTEDAIKPPFEGVFVGVVVVEVEEQEEEEEDEEGIIVEVATKEGVDEPFSW